MKQLIERYVYDVTRRLPESQREEVKKELKANIQDMLPENPNEEQIKEVLQSLGHPRVLANSYRETKHYLISPEWMDDYLFVLRIVLIILGIIGLLTGLIGTLVNPESTGVFAIFAEVIGKTIASIIESLFSGFAIVTLIFIGIERASKTRQLTLDFKRLPDLPKEKTRMIKKSGVIVSLIFTSIFGTIFLYLLSTHQLNAFWMNDAGDVTVSYALFNYSVTDVMLPILILSFLVSIAEHIFRLFKTNWDVQVYGVYSFAKVVSAVVAIIFLNQTGLISSEITDAVADVLSISQSALYDGISTALLVLSILIGLGTVADLAETWFKKTRIR